MKVQRKSGATRKTTRRKAKSVALPVVPHWGSVAFGVLIGILITTFIYFKFATSEVTLKLPTSKTTHQPQTTPAQAPPAVAQNIEESHDTGTVKPHFDFYNELTKNSHLENKSSVLDLKSRPKAINGYLVQTGSFRKRKDAEAMKAELALNGISTNIETAKLGDGEIWYRVLTGPHTDEKTAKAEQISLRQFASDSIIVHRYAE